MKNLFTPKQKQKQKKNKNKKQTKKSLLLLEDNFKYNVINLFFAYRLAVAAGR